MFQKKIVQSIRNFCAIQDMQNGNCLIQSKKITRQDINLTTFCKIAEGLDLTPDELLKELVEKLGKDFSFSEIDL